MAHASTAACVGDATKTLSCTEHEQHQTLMLDYGYWWIMCASASAAVFPEAPAELCIANGTALHAVIDRL